MSATAAPRISVLIPTYNRAPMLRVCLESVLGQTLPAAQVIVVDDGSTDSTRQCAASFGSRVVYLHKENAGKPAALNFAMPRIDGEWVWIFDDDDVALPDALERRVRALRAAPDASMVFSNHVWAYSEGDGRIRRTAPHRWPRVTPQDFFLKLMHGCFTTLQGALVRTGCYREIGPFDEGLLTSEDYDMMLRLARRYEVALLDEPTFLFRRHTGERGPVAARYSASQRERRFMTYDRIIGERLRRDLALGEYLVPRMRGRLDTELQAGAALARSGVMASKGLVDAFAEDAAAFTVQREAGRPGQPLSECERAAVSDAAGSRYMVLSVAERPTALPRALRRAGGDSPAARQLRLAVARGLLRAAMRGGLGLRAKARVVAAGSMVALGAGAPSALRRARGTVAR